MNLLVIVCVICAICFLIISLQIREINTICLKVFEAQRAICPGSREVIRAKTHAALRSCPPFVGSEQEVCQSYRNALQGLLPVNACKT